MTTFLHRSPIQIWFVLVLATALSWYLSAHSGIHAHVHHRFLTTVVLLLAFLKVHLIINSFMEIREAPAALRITMGAWVMVVFAVLVCLYMLGPG